ncbi:GNAT family protein [Agrobacterium sp. lyk4-40-TYG-31]|uniref:GNAT family N-acetyltransferase n=1 Tax=Agrobacterium sp. lyk4-40-TYG-31 TaxID=3040276 RepID=UPI00254B8041|nr:GNAT family protein [Agrobacterium sp. lyk4-40-TYG-31]
MREIVYDQVDEMLEWAQHRIPGVKFRQDASAIGMKAEDDFQGVVVFDSFTNTGCWVSVASNGSRKWINREFIIRVFAYVFIQLDYPRLNSFVSVNNTDAIRFNEHFGFQREGLMTKAATSARTRRIFSGRLGEAKLSTAPSISLTVTKYRPKRPSGK